MSSPDKFEPPAGARFFVGTDFDGNDWPIIRVVRPSGNIGYFEPDGTASGRPLMSKREVSPDVFATLTGSDNSHTLAPPASE